MAEKIIKVDPEKIPFVENFFKKRIIPGDLMVRMEKLADGVKLISGFDTHLDKAGKMVERFVKAIEKTKSS